MDELVSVAEENLLGALITSPKQTLNVIEGAVSSDDFADSRYGAVFDGLVGAIVRGTPVDVNSCGSGL
jgi:replicative DNA helicase